MAQRRMFSLKIVDTDAFLDMPQSSQLLYFHLSMRADDDGFVSNPKKIMKIVGSNDDDLKLLFTKRFVLPFESGVCVIKHWKIHNYIQNDRYMPTQYVKELASLQVDPETQKYQLKSDRRRGLPDRREDVSKVDTQVRIELELGKDNKSVELKTRPVEEEFIPLFELVNPNFQSFYSNLTERKALIWLLEKYGADDLRVKIMFLPKLNAMPFAPMVTSPYELKNKLGKISSFLGKEKNKVELNKQKIFK